jgi:hypothetical protein
MIYCSFGAESTGSIASMLSLITKVMDYFSIPVSVEEKELTGIPVNFELSQNYPNPFNPSTNIKYSIAGKGLVSIKVYDVLGNEIATLVNEQKAPGYYEVQFDTKSARVGLSSGVYFYRLITDDFVTTKKMILLK